MKKKELLTTCLIILTILFCCCFGDGIGDYGHYNRDIELIYKADVYNISDFKINL